jgi:hypothetical protein
LLVGAQLVQRAPTGHAAQVLHARGEPVALALELLEAEQPRAAEGFLARQARGTDRDVRKAGGDDLRELALQARDLLAQRSAGSRLVERLDSRRDGRCASLHRQLLGLAHAPDSSS